MNNVLLILSILKLFSYSRKQKINKFTLLANVFFNNLDVLCCIEVNNYENNYLDREMDQVQLTNVYMYIYINTNQLQLK